MSTNSSVLLDPQYLMTNYEEKKKFIKPIVSRDLTRDTENFAVVSFFGSWMLAYSFITKRNMYKSIMARYLVGYIPAVIVYSTIRKTAYV